MVQFTREKTTLDESTGRFTHPRATEEMDPYQAFKGSLMTNKTDKQKKIIMDVQPDGTTGPFNLIPEDYYDEEEDRERTTCSRCKLFGRLLINWCKVIYRIDDEKLLALNGLDASLYLVLQR